MPAFTKKTVKLVSAMNWNRSVDTIPDGQSALGVNVRANQQGEITSRPGLTLFSALYGSPAEINSISRLNNYSGLIAFTSVFIVGADTALYVGKTSSDFAAASSVPPIPGGTALSGDPLSMVDMATAGEATGWKYIGDSSQMLAVGYYPGDSVGSGGPNSGKARVLTMGMLPPVWNPAITTAAGALNGNYAWVTVFRRINTGAQSNPSAATRSTQAVPAINLVNQRATFTLPATPIDPLTGSADANIIIDVYRFGGVVNRWALVGTGASGASFEDNIPDAQILAAPAPSQFTDPITKLPRFNLFKPFPVADIGHFSTTNGTVTKDGTTGIWILTAGGSDTFDLGWLPGSSFGFGGNNTYTIYQVRSSTVIEITEDLSNDFTTGATGPWAVDTGTLVMGRPMPHIWGPYGTGSQGAVIFGCGYNNAAGTLYWTNGNDPDSSDIANSLVVTSPSEPLQGGCVYNGVAYVFSTERMFRIYPQGSGQFFTQEIGGGKGLWLEWSLNVQSNSIADQSITWRGKDGIYNYTEGKGVESLTDDTLYPLFPHENKPGDGIGTAIGSGSAAGKVFPFLNAGFSIPPPDDTQPRRHKITWFQGVLYYDYVGLVSGASKYRTLVYDTKQSKGWVSFDTYLATGSGAVTRSSEIGANNLKVAVGATLYDWGGTAGDDAGTAMLCDLITRQDDCGDERGQKLFGDVMVDLDPGGTGGGGGFGVIVIPQDNYGATALPSTALITTGRAQTPIELSSDGLGVLSRTFGMHFQWIPLGAPAIVYQYVFAYVLKPEITGKRALDKTDDGYAGAKYLRGFVIETNTFNTVRKINVLVDGTAIANPVSPGTTFTVNANGQTELPVAVVPSVGYEFQIAIDALDTSTVGWEVFQVRWIYEQWPDSDQKSSAVIAVAGGRPAYIRGFTLPLDTGGAAVQMQMALDNGATITLPLATTGGFGKTGFFYPVIPPVLAREIQLIPLSPVRAWYSEIVWDAEPWPELTTEYSPWITPANGKPCHLRGFTMPMDTGALAVSLNLQFDDGLILTVSPTQLTPAGLKSPVGFYLDTPRIVHSIQMQPVSQARCWYNEIVWDMEPWPELEPEYSPWIAPKGERAAYLRGFIMSVDTNGLTVAFQIQLASGALVAVQFQNTTAAQKSPVAFTFLPPVVSHSIRIQPLGRVRCWFDEVIWDAEEYPELAEEYTPVLDAGYPRAKFMQGAVIPIDTGGLPVALDFLTDLGVIAYTSAPVTAYGKQYITLSWPPFITHSLQIVPHGQARIWWNEITWIYEPAPELATIWQTPMTTHGLSGYLQSRLFWIAYLAAGSVIFTRALDNGTVETYNLPGTAGVYKKSLLPALPSKFLAASYGAVSALPFRLYVQDSEIHTKEWGSAGTFQPMRTIGSPSILKGSDV